MGNVCRSQPQFQQIILQIKTISQAAKAEENHLPNKGRVSYKPIFHKTSPVNLNQTSIKTGQFGTYLEEKTFRDQGEYQNRSVKILQIQSLEQILLEAQKKLDHQNNRIGVNWHSFVKIKKKDYLQDYDFIKELGKGAYGSVVKVKMRYGGLLRAAKVVKSSLISKDRNGCEKLFAQILVPMKLDHPNLIKLYQVFEHKAQYVLLMELCEGGDLFHYIRSSRFFSESKAGHLIREILSAVNYMHRMNVIHRDLKPQNILVDNESNSLKIADFGTAVFGIPNKKMTQLVGTPYYIAPQVLAKSYDEKCDVWSCGVILYILLCGHPPFNGKNEKEIMENVKSKPLQFKSPIWLKRNKKAIELVTKMLNKNPVQRISAFQALNSDWLMGLPDLDVLSKQKITEIEDEVVSNLTSFHFKNKLKAVVYTFIASQLYSNKDKDTLLRVFKEIDRDGDGVIKRQELIELFNTHSKSSLTEREVEKILSIVDTNGSGQIDFTEFLVAASNQQKLLEEKRLENAFNYLDGDHSGYITIQEVKSFLDGSEETNDEIKQIFSQVDENGDGQISKQQFLSLLLRKES